MSPGWTATFGGASGGKFAGASGQVGAVPLLLSGAAGTWRMDRGKLLVAGTSTVSDAATDPRFNPLKADQVALTLIDSHIAATGVLTTPGGVKVADVTIAHDLSRGSGTADLIVPGLQFGPGFKTDALTPLTTGVVENVVGTVSGEGHIRWSPDAVTSDGVFRTTDTDLAAAFGPVTGLSGEIRFTDLLGMVSAPDQVATVKTIDTGIAVQDGVIHYQLLGPARIQVTDAVWPFAGGRLSLDPTTLDFARSRRAAFDLPDDRDRRRAVPPAIRFPEFERDRHLRRHAADGVRRHAAAGSTTAVWWCAPAAGRSPMSVRCRRRISARGAISRSRRSSRCAIAASS